MGCDFPSDFTLATDQRDHRAGRVAPVPQAHDHGDAPQRHLVSHATQQGCVGHAAGKQHQL